LITARSAALIKPRSAKNIDYARSAKKIFACIINCRAKRAFDYARSAALIA
jgi:hypothetical protein